MSEDSEEIDRLHRIATVKNDSSEHYKPCEKVKAIHDGKWRFALVILSNFIKW